MSLKKKAGPEAGVVAKGFGNLMTGLGLAVPLLGGAALASSWGKKSKTSPAGSTLKTKAKATGAAPKPAAPKPAAPKPAAPKPAAPKPVNERATPSRQSRAISPQELGESTQQPTSQGYRYGNHPGRTLGEFINENMDVVTDPTRALYLRNLLSPVAAGARAAYYPPALDAFEGSLQHDLRSRGMLPDWVGKNSSEAPKQPKIKKLASALAKGKLNFDNNTVSFEKNAIGLEALLGGLWGARQAPEGDLGAQIRGAVGGGAGAELGANVGAIGGLGAGAIGGGGIGALGGAGIGALLAVLAGKPEVADDVAKLLLAGGVAGAGAAAPVGAGVGGILGALGGAGYGGMKGARMGTQFALGDQMKQAAGASCPAGGPKRKQERKRKLSPAAEKAMKYIAKKEAKDFGIKARETVVNMRRQRRQRQQQQRQAGGMAAGMQPASMQEREGMRPKSMQEREGMRPKSREEYMGMRPASKPKPKPTAKPTAPPPPANEADSYRSRGYAIPQGMPVHSRFLDLLRRRGIPYQNKISSLRKSPALERAMKYLKK